ncbi:Variant surface glycoprotein [Trypanosoma congolense IL3000]|uniref:Variant surface glycoprotein n=1 Tax=Trypanosoma congolense (strain IL3000) TaxID=1068625 RepID=F9WAW5_TRYCI|nr:Variant surface glycoprotein [Trypanosoma congolense IL3000]
MCKEVLYFLFLAMRVIPVGSHDNVFQKLCDITEKAFLLLKLSKNNAQVNQSLEAAIYGTDDRAHFDRDGGLTSTKGCSIWNYGRSQVCNFQNSGGCFAESLLGSLLCLCIPGKSDAKNMCGVDDLDTSAFWSGWSGPDEKENLFKNVWGNIKKKCTKEYGNVIGGEKNLKELKSAVDTIRDDAIRDYNGYFYFGGILTSDCSGSEKKNVCVKYKMDSNGNVAIPWADKINEAIQILEYAERSGENLGIAKSLASGNWKTVARKAEEKRSEHVSHEEDATQESENVSSTLGIKQLKTRNKRSTPGSQEAGIASISTEVTEDGSLITPPFSWLPFAALLK